VTGVPDGSAGSAAPWAAVTVPLRLRRAATALFDAALTGAAGAVFAAHRLDWRDAAIAAVFSAACAVFATRMCWHVWRWRRPAPGLLDGWDIAVVDPFRAHAFSAALPLSDPRRRAVQTALRTGRPVIYARNGDDCHYTVLEDV
jgi:hypothetical protein